MIQFSSVEILEVGPRDGLQNESVVFTTSDKLKLINGAIDSGIRRLEVASFVHPKRVPQMADAEAVIAGLPDRPDVTYIGLVMNERGLDRALATGIDEVGCVTLATDTFALKNQGQTSDESVQIAAGLIKKAKAEGRQANVTISAAFGCPFEGEVPVKRVAEMAEELAKAGPHEIAIADTIGVGDPVKTLKLIQAVNEVASGIPLRMHFHNTRNTAIANIFAAVQAGVSVIDSAIGGIGGCPFAPNATGNVATEDVIYMLERAGFKTNISLDRINENAQWLSEKMDRSLPGMVSRAGGFPTSQIVKQENLIG